jgi:hypothetical protein
MKNITRPGTIAQQVALDSLHCVPLARAGSVIFPDSLSGTFRRLFLR